VFYEFFISKHQNSLELFCMGMDLCYWPTMKWRGNNFRGLCLYVCVSDDNFRKPWPRNFIFAHPIYLQREQIQFIYGHRVTVMVTQAKNMECYLTPTLKWQHEYNCQNSKCIELRMGWWCTNITVGNSTCHISRKVVTAKSYYEYSSNYHT